MRKEPRGLVATFKVTKTYYISVCGDSEEDVMCNAEELDLSKISEEDLGDAEIEICSGFEYDGF
jgi:hypothetical protein